MSLLPTGVVVVPGNNYFLANDTAIPGAQTGIRYNPPWTPYASDTAYIGTVIQVPGLVPGTPVQVTIQSKTLSSQALKDAANCWLVASLSIVPDRIYVYCNAGGEGTNGTPLDNADFGLSWAVTGTSP